MVHPLWYVLALVNVMWVVCHPYIQLCHSLSYILSWCVPLGFRESHLTETRSCLSTVDCRQIMFIHIWLKTDCDLLQMTEDRSYFFTVAWEHTVIIHSWLKTDHVFSQLIEYIIFIHRWLRTVHFHSQMTEDRSYFFTVDWEQIVIIHSWLKTDIFIHSWLEIYHALWLA